MKKSILTALLSVLALGACAESVTPEMAKAAANAWVLRNEHFGAGREAVTVRTVCDTNKAQTVLWHQVSMTGNGCVFVAPVTEIEPIMVALDSDPGELPKKHPLLGILSFDVRERLRFLGLYQEDAPAGAHLQSVAPAPKTPEEQNIAAEWAACERAKWADLGVGSSPRLAAAPMGRNSVEMEVCIAKGFEKDGPLTHWNQEGSAGYNRYTPGNVVCGCVATAAAALVQFYGMNPSNTVMEAKSGYKSETQKCSYLGRPYECVTKGGTVDWSLFNDCTKPSDYQRLNANQRDVSGEAVQQGMLKLLEGSEIEVPVGASSKNAMVPMTLVDTKNILFICGGAFPDLADIIKERLNKSSSMGFVSDLKDKYDKDENILEKVTVEDLRKFGMIPEFIGRLPIIFALQSLTVDMFVKILAEPKNAIVKQYQKLLEYDEVKLEFEEGALRAISEEAKKRELGARALRSIIEDLMLDIMFEIPKDDNIGTVIITEDYVRKKGGPKILMRETQKAQKTVSA